MTLPRRTFLAASIGSALAVVHRVQAESEQRAARWITEATQTGIERGLKWLGARVKDDGSFSGGGYGRNVAVAALAGMALLSAGSTPGRGSHGAALERLQTFTLASSQMAGARTRAWMFWSARSLFSHVSSRFSACSMVKV